MSTFTDLTIFAFGRIVCGFAAGMITIAVPFYLKEIIPMPFSSRYLTAHHFMIVFGTVLPLLLAADMAIEW
jgi:MFS family permease